MGAYPVDLPPDATPAQRKAWSAGFDVWAAQERARVATQRAAFARIPARQRRELERLLLDRAWALLDANECEAADALLELVSDKLARALLDEFFPDSV